MKKKFFDFYAQNEIWFRTVGMKAYGYTETKILPYKKEKLISSSFEKLVNDLSNEIIIALEKSVRHEIRHLKDFGVFQKYDNDKGDYVLDDSAECSRIYMKYKKIPYKQWSLPMISEGFNCEWSDCQYGGELWGQATDMLIKLKSARSIKDKIFYIDRIFDLQHNNGFILNKTKFRTLEEDTIKYSGSALDYRFGASLEDLVKHASTATKMIYTANKNWIYGTL